VKKCDCDMTDFHHTCATLTAETRRSRFEFPSRAVLSRRGFQTPAIAFQRLQPGRNRAGRERIPTNVAPRLSSRHITDVRGVPSQCRLFDDAWWDSGRRETVASSSQGALWTSFNIASSVMSHTLLIVFVSC